MNYYEKYLKSKHKYIRLRQMRSIQLGACAKNQHTQQQRGGGYKIITSVFIVLDVDNFKAKINPNLETKIIREGKFYRSDLITKVTEKGYPARYEFYSNDKIKEILYVGKDNENFAKILYKNEKPIKKTFYFKATEWSMEISINNFDDIKSYTTGKGTFTLNNTEKTIILSGDSIITKGKGERFIELIIKDINISGSSIEIKNYIIENGIVTKINSIFKQTGIINYGLFMEKCMSSPITLKNLNKYGAMKRNVLNTICGSIFYYLPKKVVKELLKYNNLLADIVNVKINNIKDNIDSLLNNSDEYNKYINTLDKYLPSIFMNKYFKIKNGRGVYKTLEDKFTIEFDSGNEIFTLIGIDMVNELELKISRGCQEITTSGIGGKAKFCGEYVILDFRIDSKHPEHNNKNYKVFALVDRTGAHKNLLLFGHGGGLNKLFDDKYVIKGLYEKQDQKGVDSNEFNEKIRKVYMHLKDTLEEIFKHYKRERDYRSLGDIYHNLVNRSPIENYKSYLGKYSIKMDPVVFNKINEDLKIAHQKLQFNNPGHNLAKEIEKIIKKLKI